MNIKRIIQFLITSLTSIAIGFLLGWSFERFVDEIGWSDALHVYRMDAEHGNAEAQYYVGLYTLEGKGTKRDDTEAFRWISRSAKTGYIPAQLKLAWMYETGTGTQQDKSKAMSIYKTVGDRKLSNL